MKTNRFFLLTSILFLGAITKSTAQWQLPGNANATATSFIGTTATNPVAGQDVTFKRAGITAGKLQATTTSFGVNSLAMPSSVSVGVGAGQFSSGTGFNTYIGQNAGRGGTATALNTGNHNTFIGYESGAYITSGTYNTYIGEGSGLGNGGNNNIAIGSYSGSDTSGNNNVYIGTSAGAESGTGSGNVFIGMNAGNDQVARSNKLLIANNESINLIWGDFLQNELKLNGKVGVGVTFNNYPTTAATVNVANYNLFVKGGILTEELRVSLASTWADYVFAKDYNLKPLSEVEQFINKNQHLPNVPSAKQVAEEGINVGEMAKIQQEKIEELTLYIIQLSKDIELLKANAKN